MTFQRSKIAGIDYGSRLAGTTVIAFLNEENAIEFAVSKKNKDADRFILDWVVEYQPTHIFLDAPLSLPGIYSNLTGYQDFFYRQADQVLKAMSPMFLGGLTARAMQLKTRLSKQNIQTFEVYPGYLAKVLELDRTLYKKQKEHIPLIATTLSRSLDLPLASLPSDWHHVDALLALLSGIRYSRGQHLTFGNSQEGLIIV